MRCCALSEDYRISAEGKQANIYFFRHRQMMKKHPTTEGQSLPEGQDINSTNNFPSGPEAKADIDE